MLLKKRLVFIYNIYIKNNMLLKKLVFYLVQIFKNTEFFIKTRNF